MYIPAQLYPTAYAHILSRSRGSSLSSCTCFILVSPDVDALCAAHILHQLLKTDNINNTVIPVGSWKELEGIQERLQGEDVRNLILLNLGSLVSLAQYFPYLPATTLIHVIDSHRPINLNNLYLPSPYANAVFDARLRRHGRGGGGGGGGGGGLDGLEALAEGQESVSVVVWDDTEGDEESRESEREAFEALQYEPDSDSDDDSDDSDEEIPIRGRRRHGGEDDDDNEDDDDEDEDEEGNSGTQKRRRKSNSPQPLTKAQRRRYRAKIDKYYTAGTFSGQSVANQVFLLAVLMERADEDLLWLAILGLTHQFSTLQIDRSRYDGYVTLLSDEVARLSTQTNNVNYDQTNGPNDRSIRPSEELRFCLFRHWNLHDAMYHSGYIAGRMQLWKERGKRNLAGMLAKMGYSITQSQQTYAHMDSDLKKELLPKISMLAPEYGLHDLTFPSYIRKSGYRSDISSADAVEGIGALLEVATGVRLDFGNTVNGGYGGQGREEWADGLKGWVERHDGDKENARPRQANGQSTGLLPKNGKGGQHPEEDENADGFTQLDAEEKLRQDWSTRNFWLAWDALNPDTTLLRSALPLSMALHRAIMGQGTYILDKQAIKSLRSYRLVVIKEGPDLTVFRHPSTLLRLATWLIGAVRDLLEQQGGGVVKANARKLPFVLASLNEANDAYLVVGVIGAIEYGDVRKNSFGIAFQKAAHLSGARTRHDAFEASVVEVRRDDLDKFLQLLAIS